MVIVWTVICGDGENRIVTFCDICCMTSVMIRMVTLFHCIVIYYLSYMLYDISYDKNGDTVSLYHNILPVIYVV